MKLRMRAPEEDHDWFGQPLEPYLWLTRLIVCAVLIIGGFQILVVAALVRFGGWLPW